MNLLLIIMLRILDLLMFIIMTNIDACNTASHIDFHFMISKSFLLRL